MEGLLAADPRGDVAGLVHAQLEAAGEVALRLGELVVGDRLVAQAGQLRQDRLEGLGADSAGSTPAETSRAPASA